MTERSVDHPTHYRKDTGYEAIDVIEAWGLGFCLGNAVKYIARCGLKGDDIEDLEKARWYIDRELAHRRTRTTLHCTTAENPASDTSEPRNPKEKRF